MANPASIIGPALKNGPAVGKTKAQTDAEMKINADKKAAEDAANTEQYKEDTKTIPEKFVDALDTRNVYKKASEAVSWLADKVRKKNTTVNTEGQ